MCGRGRDRQAFPTFDLSPEGRCQVLAFAFGLPEWTGLTRNTGSGVLPENFNEYLDALFIDEDRSDWAWEYYVGDAQPTDLWRRTIEEWLDPGLPGWRTRPWANRSNGSGTP
ncbi:hypothetical protein OG417_45335 [Actinoallomurus sp. NBC_01490]|uniref:hypothetical protein n=1 Tax=Actinoallomurus sp. NBC_01490 TaxID=2903557 RepID=UPI002E374D40|nr:hypothetical protein [Actinoallomurus sp. NBC_01490]